MEEFTKGFLWEGATADFQYEGGKRFEVFVKQGQSVKTGDPLVKVDLKKI